MENQITCPHCQRKISDHQVIDDAAKHEGADTQFLTCECGERITYWQITAQLRDQKKIGVRIQKWLQDYIAR
jgi:C4-type Zn-finger protein